MDIGVMVLIWEIPIVPINSLIRVGIFRAPSCCVGLTKVYRPNPNLSLNGAGLGLLDQEEFCRALG